MLSNIAGTSYNNLDGLSIINVDEIFIGGTQVELDNYVPYTGADKTLDVGSQNIKTTHYATTNSDVVNIQVLNDAIGGVYPIVGANFLNKLTATPQTVAGAVEYDNTLTSASSLIASTNTSVNLVDQVSISTNFTRSTNDASWLSGNNMGAITSSGGVYQATTTGSFATIHYTSVPVGMKMSFSIQVKISDPSYTSSVQLYSSIDGLSISQALGPSAQFYPGDNVFKVISGNVIPNYSNIMLLVITTRPTNIQTVYWQGTATSGMGVSLQHTTLSDQTASTVPVLNSYKQLVSSTTTPTELSYLSGTTSSLQTQLNSKASITYVDTQDALRVPYTGATNNLDMGVYVVRSSTNPVSNNDLVRLGYLNSLGYVPYTGATSNLDMGVYFVRSSSDPLVDNDLTRRGWVNSKLALKANLAGGNTMTGSQTYSDQTASRVAVFDGSKNLTSSSVTTTTLGYLDATSSIQTQLNNKLNDTGDTATGIIAVDIANAYSSRASNPLPSNFVAKSSSGRLYMGSYYTGGSGVCSTIQSSDYYSGLDHGADLLLNPLGGNVVVGGDSAIARFQVNNAGGTDFLTLNNTSYTTSDFINQRFMFGTNSGTNRSAYIQAFLTSNNETDLRFFNANSGGTVAERMRIKGNGTVGIGTDSPDTTLNVWGNLKVHDGAAGPPANGTNGSTGTRIVLWTGGASSTPYALGIDASTLWYGVPTGASQKWYSGLSNTMILDGSGNLTAAGAVTCAGLQCNGTANTRHLQIERTYNINVSNGDTSQAQILFGWSGTQSQYRHNIRTGHDGGAGVGGVNNRMDFYLWGSNDAVGAIGSNRKLSINGQSTTVYARPLNVAGNNPYAVTSNQANRAGQLVIGGDEDYIGGWNAGLLMECSQQTEFNVHDYGERVASFMFYAANTFTIGRDTGWGASPTIIASRLQCNGAVGIGTASPTALLHVFGDVDGGLVSYVQNNSAGGSAYSLFACIANTDTGGLVLFQNSKNRSADGGIRTGTLRNDGGALRLQSQGGNGILIAPSSGWCGIGTASPTGLLDIYNASADYTNSLVVRTNWSSITLNNSAFGGRSWSLLSGGPGAGVGQGGFGIFDITGGAYRLGISTGGVITLYGDAVTNGNQYLNTVNQPSQTTFGNTENRLLFRNPGTGLTTTGACSTWFYINGGIAWTYGVNVDYAFYVPNTTCSIQINVTGSGYSGNVTGTYILMRVYSMFTGTYYDNVKAYFFNVTYNHTEITAHFTIPNNAWGAQTIGWKRIEFYWYYNSGGSISSDTNDTLNWTALVIG